MARGKAVKAETETEVQETPDQESPEARLTELETHVARLTNVVVALCGGRDRFDAHAGEVAEKDVEPAAISQPAP